MKERARAENSENEVEAAVDNERDFEVEEGRDDNDTDNDKV